MVDGRYRDGLAESRFLGMDGNGRLSKLMAAVLCLD